MADTTHTAQEKQQQQQQQQRAAHIINVVCGSAFLSVLQHVIQMQSEPLLMKHLLRRAKDPVSAAAKIMANTSGIVGVLGLVINQYGGKMSDLFGRHAFWFVGPLTSILSGLMVHTFSHNLFVVMACRILRLVTTTFSSSVMIGTVLSDVASGSVLAAAGAKTGAFVGAAIVVAPCWKVLS